MKRLLSRFLRKWSLSRILPRRGGGSRTGETGNRKCVQSNTTGMMMQQGRKRLLRIENNTYNLNNNIMLVSAKIGRLCIILATGISEIKRFILSESTCISFLSRNLPCRKKFCHNDMNFTAQVFMIRTGEKEKPAHDICYSKESRTPVNLLSHRPQAEREILSVL